MQISNKASQNVKIDSAASCGGQRKYMKCVSFPWSLLEAALSILTLPFFLLKTNFEKKLIENKRKLSSRPNHGLSKKCVPRKDPFGSSALHDVKKKKKYLP
jgi:hypothetical protein